MSTNRDIATSLSVTIASAVMATVLMLNIVGGYLPPVL